MTDVIQNPISKFIKVKCNKCKNEQIIYGKASTKLIKCLVCDDVLGESKGGKTNVLGKILEVVG